MKTRHTFDSFHKLEKDFSKQRLNNFARIGDSSGLILLKTKWEMKTENEKIQAKEGDSRSII